MITYDILLSFFFFRLLKLLLLSNSVVVFSPLSKSLLLLKPVPSLLKKSLSMLSRSFVMLALKPVLSVPVKSVPVTRLKKRPTRYVKRNNNIYGGC